MRALVVLLALAASALAQAADVIRGSQLYRAHCAACHGANGIAVLPNAPSFARGERLVQPDPALLASVRAGRGPMPGFFGILSDRDILDVIAYLRTLR
jgi:cytochrome c6